jgi:hypothetical protein
LMAAHPGLAGRQLPTVPDDLARAGVAFAVMCRTSNHRRCVSFGTAMRYAAEQRNLAESITELRNFESGQI